MNNTEPQLLGGSQPPFIDLFCRVVDNYGDIGVCWRLARNLSSRLIDFADGKSQENFAWNSIISNLFNPTFHMPYPVRLWVNDLQSFQRIAPAIDTSRDIQVLQNIQIIHWKNANIYANLKLKPATVVIEAFGTELDQNYIDAMNSSTRCWFNLEYLSAENWVEGFHGQRSPQSNGVPKYFFFPGFTDKTGGLIRDNQVLMRLHSFSVQDKIDWLKQHISTEVAQAFADNARLINVFCYPSAPFESLLTVFAEIIKYDHRATTFLLPEGVLPQAEELYEAVVEDKAMIKLQRFPFIPQEDFDILLSICEFNVVRGEDSFVRAIWSGKPFIWHIYEQDEQVHLHKLKAWLAQSKVPELWAEIHTAWNYFATWNNPKRREEDATNAEFQRTQAQQALENYFKHLFLGKQHPEFAISSSYLPLASEQDWEVVQKFSQDYADMLCKNPTLSFSILNFQTK